MKLLELLPNIGLFKRIKRASWNYCVIRAATNDFHPLVCIDYPSCLQLKHYTPTYEDMIADDWEIVKE